MKQSLTDKLAKMDAGIKNLAKLGILSAALLGVWTAHEFYWRNYTETGREWVRSTNARYEEFKQDSALSNYDRTAKIVREQLNCA